MSNGGVANFALHNPHDYTSTTTPKMFAPVYANGDGQKAGDSAAMGALAFWTYGDTTTGGDSAQENGDMSATHAEVGALWGVTYDSKNDNLYSSAVLRRHVGVGPLGLGGIYRLENASSATPTVVPWLDVNTLAGIDVGTDTRDASQANSLPANIADPSWDVDAYREVGRRGIGGIDLSEDNSILYLVNLKNKELIAIDTATKTLHAGFPVAIPEPVLGCSNGEYRPWGLEVHDGSIFVGVVCSGENGGDEDDLSAHVLKLNGTSFSSTPVLDIDLNYARGNIAWGNQGEWNPWTVDDLGVFI
ncbi:MAG: Unknown protein [uncultured Sulfurovum sp.]|uniref:Uncharacterized protein n=1 Tax=uncultured Sulfurovum sp. TaxID=269237 RepID=A0A6S6TY63_9BACT|nr:MAG: Unknown protein [uncultured Sulfurovum sp.]